MITVAKLKKKLRGVGCSKPQSQIDAYKKLNEAYDEILDFMAAEIEAKTKIKAAFYAMTFEDDVYWGISYGILFLERDKLFYTAGLAKEEVLKTISFDLDKLTNIALVSAENAEGFIGLNFEYEEQTYQFLSTNNEIPRKFVKEIISHELGSPQLRKLLKLINQ